MGKIIIDLEELLKRIDNDKELLKKIFHYLIDEFIDEYNNRVTRLKEFAGKKDANMVKETAHGIKGSALNLGATSLAKASLQIEAICEDNKFNELDKAIKNMDDEFNALCIYVKEEILPGMKKEKGEYNE